ncbi:MAG: homocysteine S-methyltransferase family protein [Armatimonadota bacterium]
MADRIPLLEAIKDRVLIANGAMGTMLAAAGLRLSNSAQANLDYPDVVSDIFAQYATAGATVFQSNTFAANEVMLKHSGLAERHDEVNRAGFRLVREAVGDTAYVAANFGPTGEMLAPLGTATPEQIAAVYERQARVLLPEGPDFVLLETFEALDELEAAVAGIRAAGLNVPLAITFSFSQPSGASMMGVKPQQAAQKLLELGADIIGANCGLPEVTVAALREMADLTDRPLMVQANAGLPELREGEACFSGSPEDSATLAQEAAAIGARIIGGCCGTNPAHIAAMAKALS